MIMVDVILQHSPAIEPVHQLMDKKCAEGTSCGMFFKRILPTGSAGKANANCNEGRKIPRTVAALGILVAGGGLEPPASGL